MATPRLSIGLPVYNGERYVAASIASLLGQDFGDFELIVCDNASTDRTRSIVEEFVRRDGRVRFARNELNLGAAGNFNRTFELSGAPLFKWACADDRLADGFLTAAVREMDAHPDAVLCYGRTTLIDENDRVLSEYDDGLDLRSADPAARFRSTCSRQGLLNVLQGVMRTSALRGSGMFGNFRGSDEALVVELSLRGTLHGIPHPMLFRRMHGSAASAGTTIEERQNHLDPRTKGRVSTWYWRHAVEHLKAVARSPLPLGMRVRLAGIVGRSMIRQRNHLGRELGTVASRLLGGGGRSRRA